MDETGENVITDLDVIRTHIKPYPFLTEADDPKILFDPEEFVGALGELKNGLLHGIVLRDVFPEPLPLRSRGHIRLIGDFVEANSSTIHVRGEEILTEFEGEPPVTSQFPADLQKKFYEFHDLQARIKERLGPVNTESIELAAQFGSASTLPPSPDLHTHHAGAMHITACGNAGLEILIGEVSKDDQLYLNRLNSDNGWDPYTYLKGIADRPDLEARIRTVPTNWMMIMGHALYHRSPTTLMYEGRDRLALFAL